MLDFYSISGEGIKKETRKGNWLAVSNPTEDEKEQLHNDYDLPKKFFSLGENYSNVSFLKIPNGR